MISSGNTNYLPWDATQSTAEGASFYPTTVPNLTAEASQQRAAKYDFAMGSNSPGIEAIHQSILAGNEPSLRDSWAAQKTADYQKQALNLVDTFAKNKAGQPVTGTELNVVSALSNPPAANPNTVFEEGFADKTISDLYYQTPEPDSLVNQAMTDSPGMTNAMLDVARDGIVRTEGYRKHIEDMESDYSKASGFQKAWDVVETIIPFKSWIDISNNWETLGDNLTSRAIELNQMPPAAAIEKFKHDYDEIYAHNPLDAQKYGQAMMSYGSSDALLDNFSSVMDLASVLPLGTMGKAGKALADTKTLGALGKALAGTTQTLGKKSVDYVRLLSGAGKTEDASALYLMQKAFKQQEGTLSTITEANKAEFKSLLDEAPTLSNPLSYTTQGSLGLSREYTQRLAAVLLRNADTGLSSITDRLLVERMSPSQLAAGMENAKSLLKREYSLAEDGIADMSFENLSRDPTANTWSVNIDFTKPDGTMYKSWAKADQAARKNYKFKDGDYSIQNEGQGFFVRINRPIDETSDAVKSVGIETGHETPVAWHTWLLGKMRPTGDTQATDINISRNVVTHGVQNMFAALQEIAQPIKSLNKVSRKNLNDFLKSARSMTPDGFKSQFYNTQTEFEQAWMNTFHQLPSYEESLAYGSYLQLYDWDHVFRNLSVYRGLSRQGIREFKLKIAPKGDLESEMFHGRVVKELPTDSSASILVYEKDGTKIFLTPAQLNAEPKPIRTTISKAEKAQEQKIVSLKEEFKKTREARDEADATGDETAWSQHVDRLDELKVEIKKAEAKVASIREEALKAEAAKAPTKAAIADEIKKSLNEGGYQIIQVADPYNLPLKNSLAEDKFITHIITKDASSSPLKMTQLEKTEGGHIRYNYGHAVKQPKVEVIGGRKTYTGDLNLKPFVTEKEASEYAKAMTEAQQLFDKGKRNEFKNFVEKNLPEDESELWARFSDGTINPRAPIVPITTGVKTIEHPSVRDYATGADHALTSNLNLYRDVNRDYIGPREYVRDVRPGSEDNPVFNFAGAKLIEPLPVINRQTATLGRNAYVEDMRTQAATHFVNEFADTMRYPKEYLQSNPIAALFHPEWNKAANPQKLAAAKLFQLSFKQFMSVETDIGKATNYLKAKLMESIHGAGYTKTAEFVSDHMLAKITDPLQAARFVAYSMKLGLGNITQFFKQLNTFWNIAGIAGIRLAMKAAPMYFFHRGLMMLNDTPEMIEHFAGMAIKWGWKKEHFKEAYEAARRNGIFNVEGEHSYIDNIKDPTFFTGKYSSKFDKASFFFFREGERSTRITAWNTAYLEWREANPFAKFDNAAQGKVLLRQHTLNASMTRATQTPVQGMFGGVLSFPLQFLNYPIRIMEQFVGKRLSGLEKRRLFATYSAIYGVPAGVVATPAGIWPWHEDLDRYLQDKGIKDTNPFIEAFHRGVVETMVHAVTGEAYNIPNSYGPGGLSIIKDMNPWSDKTWWEIMGGASSSVISQTLDSTYPLVKDLLNIGTVGYKVTSNDFVNVLKNVSSVNNTTKLAFGLNAYRYMTKNNIAMLDEMSTFDGFMAVTFGLQPQAMENISRAIETSKSMSDTKDYAKKQMVKYIRNSLQAEPGDDRIANWRAAMLWFAAGGFQHSDLSGIISEASKGYENLFDQLNAKRLEEGLGQMERH